MAGALFEADRAAGASLVVVAVAPARAELDDGVLRAGRPAIVAFETIAAGQAALCLVARLAARSGPPRPRRNPLQPARRSPAPSARAGSASLKTGRFSMSNETSGCLGGFGIPPCRAASASIWRAARLPWPTAAVTVRSPGTMSPPAKMPAWPVIMSGPTTTVPSGLNSMPGTRAQERAVGLLAERQHDGVGLERLESLRSAAACPSRRAPSARP